MSIIIAIEFNYWKIAATYAHLSSEEDRLISVDR